MTTIRELIEMLAKCNWDDEVTCAEKDMKSILVNDEQHHANRKITGVCQIAGHGTQIVFED